MPNDTSMSNAELSASLLALHDDVGTEGSGDLDKEELAMLSEAARRIALHDPVDLLKTLLEEAPESRATGILLADREWLAKTLTGPQTFFDLAEAWKDTTMGRVPDVEVLSFALKWIAMAISKGSGQFVFDAADATWPSIGSGAVVPTELTKLRGIIEEMLPLSYDGSITSTAFGRILHDNDIIVEVPATHDVLGEWGDHTMWVPRWKVVQEHQRPVHAPGEFEELKRFGIVLHSVDIDRQALTNTSKATSIQLTDLERSAARLQLITEKAQNTPYTCRWCGVASNLDGTPPCILRLSDSDYAEQLEEGGQWDNERQRWIIVEEPDVVQTPDGPRVDL